MPLAVAGPKQQLPAGDSKGRSTGAASKKPVPLPKVSKGCWLDTLKVQAHAKRRAAILAVGASKRAALGQGPRPAAAAATGEEGEPLCTPPEAGGGSAAAEGGTMAILCCISSMRGIPMLSSGLSKWRSFWDCSTLHSSSVRVQ
jgi:hypothetical protein